MLKIHHNQVPKYIIDRVKKFYQLAIQHIPVKHTINLYLYHQPVLRIIHTDGKEEYCFGCFVCTGKIFNKPKTPCIMLITKVPPIIAVTRTDKLNTICLDLCHELIHYEQWKKHKKFTERGVQVRAYNLTKKLLKLL